jgi:hypothetical protein
MYRGDLLGMQLEWTKFGPLLWREIQLEVGTQDPEGGPLEGSPHLCFDVRWKKLAQFHTECHDDSMAHCTHKLPNAIE